MNDFPLISSTLCTMYGCSVLSAPPESVLWAADCILDTDHAKRELRAANEYRNQRGRVTVYPSHGSRLF